MQPHTASSITANTPTGVRADVLSHLDKISASVCFERSAKLLTLLSTLVHETLLNGGQRVKAVTLTAMSESGLDNADSSVRVGISRLRQALERYYRSEGLDDPWRFDIPKGQYTVDFKRRGRAYTLPNRGHSIAFLGIHSPSSSLSAYSKRLSDTFQGLLGDSPFIYLVDLPVATAGRPSADELRSLREQQVALVIAASLQTVGDQHRVYFEVVDAEDGKVLWMSTFDPAPGASQSISAADEEALARLAQQVAYPCATLERIFQACSQSDMQRPAAIAAFYKYQEQLTTATHLAARDGLEGVLKVLPDYAEAWACLADIYCGEFSFAFNAEAGALDRARVAAERAIAIDPRSRWCQFNLAQVRFFQKDLAGFRELSSAILEKSPSQPMTLAMLGLFHCYDDCWAEGLALLDRARSLNPTHPGWYWLPYAAHAFNEGDYKTALHYSVRTNMPGFFWYHLFLAMTHAELGNKAEAKSEVLRLQRAQPLMKTQATKLIQRIVHNPDLLDRFLASLKKAGLKIT